MMPSTRTRRASRRKSTSPSMPRLRNNSKRSMLCLTTVVLLGCVLVAIKDDAVVSFWLHRLTLTPLPGTLLTDPRPITTARIVPWAPIQFPGWADFRPFQPSKYHSTLSSTSDTRPTGPNRAQHRRNANLPPIPLIYT